MQIIYGGKLAQLQDYVEICRKTFMVSSFVLHPWVIKLTVLTYAMLHTCEIFDWRTAAAD